MCDGVPVIDKQLNYLQEYTSMYKLSCLYKWLWSGLTTDLATTRPQNYTMVLCNTRNLSLPVLVHGVVFVLSSCVDGREVTSYYVIVHQKPTVAVSKGPHTHSWL